MRFAHDMSIYIRVRPVLSPGQVGGAASRGCDRSAPPALTETGLCHGSPRRPPRTRYGGARGDRPVRGHAVAATSAAADRHPRDEEETKV